MSIMTFIHKDPRTGLYRYRRKLPASIAGQPVPDWLPASLSALRNSQKGKVNTFIATSPNRWPPRTASRPSASTAPSFDASTTAFHAARHFADEVQALCANSRGKSPDGGSGGYVWQRAIAKRILISGTASPCGSTAG